MLRAACHCTAIRIEVATAPEWVVDCNCSLCRRYGALWAYYKGGGATLVRGEGETDAYVQGKRWFEFHRCKHCGCITHHTDLRVQPPRIRGVNARMMPWLDPKSVRLQHSDNGHTGFFWTRIPDLFQKGEQPPPESDGWR